MKLTITAPVCRQSNGGATSGTIYMKLLTADAAVTNEADPSSSNYSTKATWSGVSHLNVFTITFSTISVNLTPGATYYAYFANGSMDGFVNFGYSGYSFSVKIDYDTWTDGSVSTPTLADTGKNQFKVTGTITAGTNNSLSSAYIYYTLDGTTPTTSSKKVSISGSSYSKNVSISSTCTVKAMAWAKFAEGDTATATSASKTITFYGAGTAASTPTITDNVNNTFTISGTVGKSGTNNAMQTATLYYTLDGTDPTSSSTRKTVSLTTTSGAAYSNTYSITASKTVKACVVCTFAWGSTDADKTKTSAVATTAVKYYTAITINTPLLNIVDNKNNTFEIVSADPTSGSNNAANVTCQWDYTTSYSNAGKGIKNLTIIDKTADTRTVYAKVVIKPTWKNDPNYNSGNGKSATMSLAINQYIAPSMPGIPILSYSRRRLTLEEPWTFTWEPSTAYNNNSPVIGYLITLLRCPSGKDPEKTSNWEAVSGVDCSSSDNFLTKNSTTSTEVKRESTSCVAVIQNPADFGFTIGDYVKLRIRPFTTNGKNETVTNKTTEYVESSANVILEAGLMRVKVDGEWKTGKVYVKQNGRWHRAKSVDVKVKGEWIES
jgi:hypothetical protein